jgi:hypothetical protein
MTELEPYRPWVHVSVVHYHTKRVLLDHPRTSGLMHLGVA